MAVSRQNFLLSKFCAVQKHKILVKKLTNWINNCPFANLFVTLKLYIEIEYLKHIELKPLHLNSNIILITCYFKCNVIYYSYILLTF